MMDPYYSWNPPIQTTLTAVGLNDTDDYQINIDDNDNDDQDDDPIPTGTSGGGGSTGNRMEFRPLCGDPSSPVPNGEDHTSNNTTLPATEICQGNVVTQHLTLPATEICRGNVVTQHLTLPGAEICIGEVVPQHLIPSRISKSTQWTLDQFDNNYRLFSQKLKNDDSNLTIRVVLLRNNLMFLNYTFNILGSSNVLEAILASTYIMCSKLLEHISKGDTLLCSLEAGYICVQNSIIRNKHVYNLVLVYNKEEPCRLSFTIFVMRVTRQWPLCSV